MKNLVREQNIENFQKYKIKSEYLKKISYVSITMDLISFTVMEILKLIYHDEGLFGNEVLFFIGKVNNIFSNKNLGFYNNESIRNYVLFNK